MALHKDATGADLHEPKGVATATSGQVYQANGLGSGVWSTLDIPSGTFYISSATFTSSGTWTKPTGMFACEVYCIGGGGGSIQTSTTTAAGNGGTTSFGSYFSATGGTGGSVNATGPAGTGGTGGSGSSGDFNFTGETGYGPGSVHDWDNSRISKASAGLLISTYGKGGGVVLDNPSSLLSFAAGGGGGAAIKFFRDTDLTSTVSVTIGAAGTAGAAGEAGIAGLVIVKQYITV